MVEDGEFPHEGFIVRLLFISFSMKMSCPKSLQHAPVSSSLWNSSSVKSTFSAVFVQRLGNKSLRQIKDEEGFTLYPCLCCVWLSALFSSGRVRAGIKVRVALYMALDTSAHTFMLWWRRDETHSGQISFFIGNYQTCSGNGLHGALTSDLFLPQSVASQIYHSQSALRFYNVGFPL